MKEDIFIVKAKLIAQADTSADPENWTPENPLWGHCAVLSLLAQDFFGGDLIRGSLKEHPKYSYLKSHYWNRIGNKDIDFTKDQYNDLSYKDLSGEVRSRASVLEHPDTVRRYELLKSRFLNYKSSNFVTDG